MATVYDLISQVLRRLDELSITAPVHWTRAEILVFVNEALSELNLIAWEFKNSVSITLNSTDNVYDIPSPMIAAVAMRAPNYLRRQSVDDLDHEANWESSTENRLNVRTWAPVGLTKIVIHPRPIANITGYIEGIVEHTAVTDAAVALPVPAEYESAVEDFCVERATFKEGPSEMEQAGRHYQRFLEQVQEISGRNVIRMYPRYSSGVVGEDNLREQVEGGEKIE